MRTSMEPLTYRHGVDVFFYGHVHAYERTHPVYDYIVDPCGSVHITIGDGGNSEGLSFLAANKMSPGKLLLPHGHAEYMLQSVLASHSARSNFRTCCFGHSYVQLS